MAQATEDLAEVKQAKDVWLCTMQRSIHIAILTRAIAVSFMYTGDEDPQELVHQAAEWLQDLRWRDAAYVRNLYLETTPRCGDRVVD